MKINTRFILSAAANANNQTRAIEPVYTSPYEGRSQMPLHRLERMFGAGSIDKGDGPKPARVRLSI